MYNPFSLKDKVILVTGASSGIGKSIAIECSRLGATVIITGRNRDRLEDTYTQLFGDKNELFVADLCCFDSYSSICSKLPVIDGLVNCAGITKTVLFQFMSQDDLDSVMDINFKSPLLFTQGLLKFKKIRKGASIVFVSSISGVMVSSYGNTIYSSSKGAINGLFKNIALELSSKQIRVNSVNPGMISTDILASGEISEAQLVDDIKKYPLKRYGMTEDVAFGVIYFLSDASKWVTGSNLVIDGGFSLL